MNSRKLEKYKKELVAMRARLTNDYDQMIEGLREAVNIPGELTTVADHNADHDTEGLATAVIASQTEVQLLEQVNAALARIEEGTYGKCADCGCDIPEMRLEILPYASYCVDCGRKAESEQRQGE
jgi:RNA polymerase-binding protein DksA